jgi:endonuclease-8
VAFVPEGDTIYRAAAALRTALVGQKLVRFDAPRLVGPAPVAGRTIETVRSHGKHLEIIFDDGIVLHSHMRMTGSWHLYHPGERWRRPHRQMRAIIDTADWQAVCFNAPVLETYRVPDRRRHPGMGNLGPDLCSTSTDLRRCVDLVLSYPDPEETVAEVMLDQRVMCGIGNVYRSEVLWACELSPWEPVGTLSEARVEMLVNTAARLLRANLQYTERITTANVKGGLAVYGRTMQMCVRCHGTIESTRHGEFARVVYWCPGCQRRHDPQVEMAPEREMDPHPAAAQYLRDLPWRREQARRVSQRVADDRGDYPPDAKIS